MKTFLIIALSILIASLAYHYLVCPRLCVDCTNPKDVHKKEYQLKGTEIYFKGFDGTTAIEIEHIVQSKSVFSGKFYPTDSIFHSFNMWDGNQLKYRFSQDTSFNTLEWISSIIDTNFHTYLGAIEISTGNSEVQCPSSVSRKVLVTISSSFASNLVYFNACQDGFRVCEEGNPSNCMDVYFNEPFSIQVNVNPTTCKANGLILSCDNGGTLLGTFRNDDPDDENIRIFLGGMFNLPFPGFPRIDDIGSEIPSVNSSDGQ